MSVKHCFGILAAIALLNAADAVAQDRVDFGDDSSVWSRDGECDDPRFEGQGMATTLLDEDLKADATDCRILYERGLIRLRGTSFSGGSNSAPSGDVDFGNNSSDWANDGECDDPRFEGQGMASVLLDEDLGRDANDCRALYNSGMIRLVGSGTSMTTRPSNAGDINFGNDTSDWAHDGECDDPRFVGTGMAAILLDEDLGRDATDCRNLYNRGSIRLR